MYKQRGITLIESLLALAISSILLYTLFALYFQYYRSRQVVLNLNAIMTTGQNVLTLLAYDIQHAGYIGCARLEPGFPLRSEGNMFTYTTRIELKSHELKVQYADYPLDIIMHLPANTTMVSVAGNYREGDRILISDCRHAELLRVNKIFKSGNISKLTFTYPAVYSYQFAAISRFHERHYYLDKRDSLVIKDNDSVNEYASGIKNLYFSRKGNMVCADISIGVGDLTQSWHLDMA